MKKIIAYSKKYGVSIPENKRVFWAGVYKAILSITDAPEDLKEKSAAWLTENGFKLEIK